MNRSQYFVCLTLPPGFYFLIVFGHQIPGSVGERQFFQIIIDPGRIKNRLHQFEVVCINGLQIEVWRPTRMVGIALLIDFDKLQAAGSDTLRRMMAGIRAFAHAVIHHEQHSGFQTVIIRIDQYSTLLPFSDLDEARSILQNFTKDFRQNGLISIENAAREDNPAVRCFEFLISAGLAGGNPNVELDSIMSFAEFNQEPIAQFQCNI